MSARRDVGAGRVVPVGLAKGRILVSGAREESCRCRPPAMSGRSSIHLPAQAEAAIGSGLPLDLVNVQGSMRAAIESRRLRSLPSQGGGFVFGGQAMSRYPAPGWEAQPQNFPVGWRFCAAQGGGWWGIDQSPNNRPGGPPEHLLDTLVPSGRTGLDPGTTFGSSCDVQSEFDQWTELTVPEIGGALYGCATGFPCAPWRTIDIELPVGLPEDPGGGPKIRTRSSPQGCRVASPFGASTSLSGGAPLRGVTRYQDGPVVTLRLGAATMQWCWICVSLSSDLVGLAGTRVSLTARVGSTVIGRSNGLVATTSGSPTHIVRLTVRCRSESLGQPVLIEMFRSDVGRSDSDYPQDAGRDGVVTARAYGRLGYLPS